MRGKTSVREGRLIIKLKWISSSAALRWVAEMRDKSNDPLRKYNAEKTIALLRSLSGGQGLPEHTEGVAKEPPSEVAHRFVRVESGLLPDQWNQLTSFLWPTIVLDYFTYCEVPLDSAHCDPQASEGSHAGVSRCCE